MEKKAQIWGVDVMIALILFITGLIIFYFFALNYVNESNENIESLFFDGELIMNMILSEGDLSQNQIRILSSGKINETSLENFYLLGLSDYPRTKAIFNTNYDYFFSLSEDIEIDGQIVSGIGKQGITEENVKGVDSENLVHISRLTIYKEKPVTARIYIWG